MDTNDKERGEEIHEAAQLLRAVLEHNHVEPNIALNALAWILARLAQRIGFTHFEVINAFASTVKLVYEHHKDEYDTGEEGQG